MSTVNNLITIHAFIQAAPEVASETCKVQSSAGSFSQYLANNWQHNTVNPCGVSVNQCTESCLLPARKYITGGKSVSEPTTSSGIDCSVEMPNVLLKS